MSKRKKAVRAAFRDAVFTRDGFACVMCGAPHTSASPLDAHHITDRNAMPHGGYVAANGISLCPTCHELAEVYHSSGHTECADGFHPDELYARIRSSLARAIKDSERLLS